jgi:PAS domain S-box-containing protein
LRKVGASWNPGAEELLGYHTEEITGHAADLILPEERRREFATAVKRALGGDHIERFETLCARADGSQVEVEATLSAVRDRAGRLAGTAVVLRDLTERRRAENEAARARRHEQQLLIPGDRERIARDLHDRVIQRIFAAGLTLEGTVAMARPVVADRIQAVVGELDAAIAEIRQTIFALEHERPAAGLRAEILNLVTGTAAQLGHQPAISIEGPIETVVSDEAAGHLLAVLREALTNVARHAHARATSIDLAAGDSELVSASTTTAWAWGTPPAGAGWPTSGSGTGTRRIIHHQPAAGQRHQAGVARPAPGVNALGLVSRGKAAQGDSRRRGDLSGTGQRTN